MTRTTRSLRRAASAVFIVLAATLAGCCSTPTSVTNVSQKTIALNKTLDAKQQESLKAYAEFTKAAEARTVLLLEAIEKERSARVKATEGRLSEARKRAVYDAYRKYQEKVIAVLSTELDAALETNLRTRVKEELKRVEKRYGEVVNSAGGAPSTAQLNEMNKLQREYRQIELLAWREEAVFRSEVAEMARVQSEAVLGKLQAAADEVKTPTQEDWHVPSASYEDIRTSIEGFRSEVAAAAKERANALSMIDQYLNRPSVARLLVGGVKDGVSATISGVAKNAGDWVKDKVGDNVLGVDVGGFVEKLVKGLDPIVTSEVDAISKRITGKATGLWTKVDDKFEEFARTGA